MSLDPAKYENLTVAEIVRIAGDAAPLEQRIRKFIAFTPDDSRMDKTWTHDASYVCVLLSTLRQAAAKLEQLEDRCDRG